MNDRVAFLLGTFQNLSVSQNQTVQATVSGIPPAVAYVTLQFHTQHRAATLSSTRVPGASPLSAPDTGLLSPLAPGQTSLSLFLTTADIGPVAGTGTTVRFAPAGVGYARGATPPSCNVSTATGVRRRLLYDVYRHFLPPGDQSEKSLFSGLQGMASAQDLRQNASLNETVAVVTSVPGRGVIYAVVVRDPERNTSAAYVPAHTYACSFDSALDGCTTLGQISTKVFFTLTGLAGLFVCFFGHRFFKCELFFVGFGFSAFLFFVLITRTTTLEYDLRLSLTVVMGAVGGAMLVTSWWRFGSVAVCAAVVGLVLGFLLASTVFFTPFGDLDVFRRSELAFWITCVYSSTTLAYITLNVLARFLNVDYSSALADAPLHDNDFVLITVWVVLGTCGVVLQLYRERARPFFPPSPYLAWRQERDRRNTNVLDPSHHVPSLGARALARLRSLGSHGRRPHRRRRQDRDRDQDQPNGEHTPLLL
ncbi:hypothetical protein CRUP_037146 [Coryphaenoides rupestris]|nr:hypothetical protein CRUP_037146 [Coryphaenoides rupestris]